MDRGETLLGLAYAVVWCGGGGWRVGECMHVCDGDLVVGWWGLGGGAFTHVCSSGLVGMRVDRGEVYACAWCVWQ